MSLIRERLEQETTGWRMIKAAPGAWLPQELVLRQGVEFEGAPLPRNFTRMTPKMCFANAAALVRRRRNLRYCEGYVTADDLPLCMHHAWVTDAENRLIDPTLEHPEQWSYLGIILTREEYDVERFPRTPCILLNEREQINFRYMLRRCPALLDLIDPFSV